jgi:N-acetylglutamate synthase-like GNAT family acetyltransferase
MKIEQATLIDFNEITHDIVDFWGSDRTLHLHQPYLIHEFGNTAFVIREADRVIAYLFGFYSQTHDLAYIHLVGVRVSQQRKGLGNMLYEHFIALARERGIHKIKAITTPGNTRSINFHSNKIGMSLLGEPDENGIPVVRNYSGTNHHRVVFEKMI